jgi:hypothetical protein
MIGLFQPQAVTRSTAWSTYHWSRPAHDRPDPRSCPVSRSGVAWLPDWVEATTKPATNAAITPSTVARTVAERRSTLLGTVMVHLTTALVGRFRRVSRWVP